MSGARVLVNAVMMVAVVAGILLGRLVFGALGGG